MRVISLGSGSSGNATVIQSGGTTILVDAGFASRILVSRLRQVGLAPGSVQAILLTHEHGDHACGALALAAAYQIPLVSDPLTRKAVERMPISPESRAVRNGKIEQVPLDVGRSTRVGTLDVQSFPTSHDAVAPCGFLISGSAWKVCVVTDTGEATPAVVEAMREAHLLVIEANHDRERLLAGPYPLQLKMRILSATGHLSNQQTSEALASTLDDGPRWVWLAHLSRTNNTPALASTQVRDYLRSRGLGHTRIEVAPPGVGPTWDSSALWNPAPPPTITS
ncbi:MAG: MBL fold metallo-hydrolase [Chloroflexi bacterium]|nr:MAG: MBL fold metallo-hydrolase [Chloroflexota bacterium]